MYMKSLFSIHLLPVKSLNNTSNLYHLKNSKNIIYDKKIEKYKNNLLKNIF